MPTTGDDVDAPVSRASSGPRIVRAETPGADGVLTGRTFTRERVELSAILNAGDNAAQIVVYKPRRLGSDWLLEPIAVARTK